MSESEHTVSEVSSTSESQGDQEMVRSLVAQLARKDGLEREAARERLVTIGEAAIAPLIRALKDGREMVRWEAAKALGEIHDAAAARALVESLEDRVFDIRWLAAEGLIAIGHKSLPPLLRALEQRSDSKALQNGAHHVAHALAKDDLKEVLRPLLVALEDVEPSVEVPFAALAVLNTLASAKWQHDGRFR
jgi:HEAT repeat protein